MHVQWTLSCDSCIVGYIGVAAGATVAFEEMPLSRSITPGRLDHGLVPAASTSPATKLTGEDAPGAVRLQSCSRASCGSIGRAMHGNEMRAKAASLPVSCSSSNHSSSEFHGACAADADEQAAHTPTACSACGLTGAQAAPADECMPAPCRGDRGLANLSQPSTSLKMQRAIRLERESDLIQLCGLNPDLAQRCLTQAVQSIGNNFQVGSLVSLLAPQAQSDEQICTDLRRILRKRAAVHMQQVQFSAD